jgi:uncharacterized protein (TIGR03435 family)
MFCMKSAAAVFLSVVILLTCSRLPAQAPSPLAASTPLPQFDAVTIKHRDPKATTWQAGFYSYPGGRIFFGGFAKIIVQYAYNVRDYQVAGDPGWTSSEWLVVNAVPPADSPSRALKIRQAEPTDEQRQMLQSLLRDRFGLKCHFETREGEVYLLTRGKKPLKLLPPKDPTADPRALITIWPGNLAKGDAVGTNTTTDYMATMFSRYLHMPVLNKTGITGSWDFELDPDDPENHDIPTAVYSVIDRLGLKIKRSRGPIQTLVIDHIDHPTAD